MSNDNVRTAFEVWADDQGYPLGRLDIGDGDDYSDMRTDGAWGAWQAALAAPAQPDTWRAAVLDALTATGSDMPAAATPAEIVRAVIDAHVQIALDPRVSDAAPAQQPEPLTIDDITTLFHAITSRIVYDESPEQMFEVIVRAVESEQRKKQAIAAPAPQPWRPTEQQILQAAEEAGLLPNTIHSWMPAVHRFFEALENASQSAQHRAPLTLEQIGDLEFGQAGVPLTWDQRVTVVRAAERAHGITAAPKEQA